MVQLKKKKNLDSESIYVYLYKEEIVVKEFMNHSQHRAVALDIFYGQLQWKGKRDLEMLLLCFLIVFVLYSALMCYSNLLNDV